MTLRSSIPVVVILLAGADLGFCQLPNIAPTISPNAPPNGAFPPRQPVYSAPSNASRPAPPAAPLAPLIPVAKPVGTARRAQVLLSGNQLSIHADNSSLNQILRQVARDTGMTISGGVREERVYGKFGPAPVGKVLGELLDGTGSNMFLKETAGAMPAELILTVRGGGPTPPNPSATAFEDAQNDVPALPQPAPAPSNATTPPPMPISEPPTTPAITDTRMTPVTPPPSGIVSAPTSAPATEPGTTPGPNTQATGTSGTTTTPSPNGVKTPQEIYQELQQLLQQQQKQQGH